MRLSISDQWRSMHKLHLLYTVHMLLVLLSCLHAFRTIMNYSNFQHPLIRTVIVSVCCVHYYNQWCLQTSTIRILGFFWTNSRNLVPKKTRFWGYCVLGGRVGATCERAAPGGEHPGVHAGRHHTVLQHQGRRFRSPGEVNFPFAGVLHQRS